MIQDDERHSQPQEGARLEGPGETDGPTEEGSPEDRAGAHFLPQSGPSPDEGDDQAESPQDKGGETGDAAAAEDAAGNEATTLSPRDATDDEDWDNDLPPLDVAELPVGLLPEPERRPSPLARFRTALHNAAGGYLTTIITYGFPVVLIALAQRVSHDPRYAWMSLVELVLLWSLTNLLVKRLPRVAGVVKGILLALFNIQQLVLLFGGTYVSAIMLSNLGSIEDIQGGAGLYALGIAALVLLTFLRTRGVGKRGVADYAVLAGAVVAWGIAGASMGWSYSPLVSYPLVLQETQRNAAFAENVKNGHGDAGKFYHDGVQGGIDKPAEAQALGQTPNVVLIFTEGLSQSVVEDPRSLMPNVASYEQRSLDFTNYYNHTFATYRGLQGQLFSGEQLGNLDSSNYVSLQGILGLNGYQTTFINVEPNNSDFTSYLNDLGFNQVITEEGVNPEGGAQSLSDRQAYEYLLKTMEEQNGSGKPFFIAMYTVGTHATFDSPDKRFGDGSDPELNKFYNADYWFGQFMSEFQNSDLADNTIIVFTADHASYVDMGWNQAFPDYERAFGSLDRVPFFIYYKGVKPQKVDAQGRNSLDMAPTLLDYLDVSAPNYFLGSSLFLQKDPSKYLETTFWQEGIIRSTATGQIETMSQADQDKVTATLQEYFAAKGTTSGGSGSNGD